MNVEIDSESGFCFGVTSAIKKAEEELKTGETLYCLGDIVHNGQEVKRLDSLGLITIDYDDLRTLHNVRVLLRAHGEPPSTYHIANQNHITLIDASCPVVRNLQKRIRETYTNHRNAQIVIFGKEGHAEVIGLQGQTNNTAIVIESPKDIHKIDFTKDIYLFSQTTKSVEEFEEIIRLIQSMIANGVTFEFYDTICKQVRNRVKHLREFAQNHDMIIFVGGKKSSNAKVLYEHCLDANPNTYFVADSTEIVAPLTNSIRKDMSIGICGATSTPLWLMEECKEKLLSLTID